MYAEERQQLILERARELGRVDVASLASLFQVTPETVRRDLTSLERHGVLRRVHGGAIPVERLGFEPSVATRSDRFVAEKERIAKAALEQLPDEGTVLLDAGTTTLRLAEALPRDRELTVVTNSLPIAAVIAERGNIDLYLLGGRVRPRTLAAVGAWVAASLADIFVDVAFVGTNGLSVRRGLTTPDQSEAAAKQAMIAAARRSVVLTDHSKMGVDHFSRVAALRDLAMVITDSGLDPETAHEIEAEGPEVVRA
ncbi:MAG TPA: DeoR/GlpR family DNA-binding transcription regulator [Dermatophilaceae bacterium]|nr:DeoR/GlpR family DNA-binding transcription regulator [Dermatophilaceae bacterium]